MLKVVIVDVLDPKISALEAKYGLQELENLINTFGGLVVVKKIQKKQVPDYQTFVGSGKLLEIQAAAVENQAELIIFNNLLKAKQIYNIEKILHKDKIKVWDRVDLILKIFDKHAETAEAKLQIELAALHHLGPRIFGLGMDLSRQGGGIGTKGIGETNTEIMKRHIADLEKKVKDKLKKYEAMHQTQIVSRQRKNLKTVAIVGYTNAGKSQLLCSLTKKTVKVKDELFATLDTRLGELFLPELQKTCLLSDTIGFIQNLPPTLIQPFKSTLNETVHADPLLHVVDYSDPQKLQKIKVVNEVLTELGVFAKPTILVCNKMDLSPKAATKTFMNKFKKYSPVFISAKEKTGLKELVKNIESRID